MTGPCPWSIHCERHSGTDRRPPADIAIGWNGLGRPWRRFAAVWPGGKPGAVPVEAEVLDRLAREMQAGDVVRLVRAGPRGPAGPGRQR